MSTVAPADAPADPSPDLPADLPADVSASPQPADVPAEPPPAPAPMEPQRARRPRRVLRFVAGFVAGFAAILVVLGAGLLAWDAGYEGRILPGVHVGNVDLSGLDRASAARALATAYAFDQGRVVLRTEIGELTVAYADFGRRPDLDAMLDEASRAGRDGTVAERAVREVRLALDGITLEPRMTLDEAALADRVGAALRRLERAPIDASVFIASTGPVTTASRAGRTVDPAPVLEAVLDAARRLDAPAEIVVPVESREVPALRGDLAVENARIQAERVIGDVTVSLGKKKWRIPMATVRTWVHFDNEPGGSTRVDVDSALIAKSLGRVTKGVLQKPVAASFLTTKRGKVIGAVASQAGRALDTDGMVAAISAELMARVAGSPPAPVKAVTVSVAPSLSTEEALKTAPLMVRLGTWTTWFPISERNYFGANIWLPARIINGTVLAAGQTFEWWGAVGPITGARGFGPGGVIKTDHTEPTGALGGGMCSSSTTLFNAALRAGLQMGARSNHRYYINRYPLGLDATVSISKGGGRQTMSFTNDTGHPILIRGIRIGGKSGRGWVRYEIWGVPNGRQVSISRPSVWNVRQATTNVVPVTTLRHGVRKQTEFPANGMDVSVTRVVRDAEGRVIHRDTYVTHYTLWNGRIEVGI